MHVAQSLDLETRRYILALLLLSALAAVGSACQQSAAPAGEPAKPALPKGTDRLRPEYDDAGKLTKLEYDRNNDGKVDAWGYMDGSRVVRIEVDENGDGAVDRWEFHRSDAAAGAPAGTAPSGVDNTMERIERATKFDGKVSRWEHFADGALTAIEEDTDADGKIDKWETYVDGSLRTMALDTAHFGRPDRRLVYSADGSLAHIEADPTGSGTFTPLKP